MKIHKNKNMRKAKSHGLFIFSSLTIVPHQNHETKICCKNLGASPRKISRQRKCHTYIGDESDSGFEMMRMKGFQTVKDYAEQFLTIGNKVRLLGKEFYDERIVQNIFVMLPEKYEPTISFLENSKGLSSITLVGLLNARLWNKEDS